MNIQIIEMLRPLLFLIIMACTHSSEAQSVAINTDGNTAHPSSILDVQSEVKGVLVPRMTKAQRNDITVPAKGLLVFITDADSTGFHYHDGTRWLWLEALDKAGWKIKGNTGTDTGINFIGTLDDQPLRFKQNSQHLGLWDLSKGNYYLGRQAGVFHNGAATNSIAIGDSALSSPGNIVSSGHNIAIGNKALRKHQSQIGNIAIGSFSLQNFVSNSGGGFGSVGIGYAAMNSVKTGTENVGIGSFALQIDTTGSSNTALGALSLGSKKNGNGNIGVGYASGGLLRIGNNNTFLGAFTNNAMPDSLVNATAIGAHAQVDTSNAIVLGSINGVNFATTDVNVGIGTTKPKTALHVSKGPSGNSTNSASRIVTIEDNNNAYVQLLNPDDREAGLLSGNASTLVRSGIVFTTDSSIRINAGGNVTRMIIADDGNVGINTLFPLSKLHVNGSFATPVRLITASTTLDANDHTIIISNTSVGSVLTNLPLATTMSGREYVIVNQTATTQPTNFAYRDITGTSTFVISAQTAITLKAFGGGWFRVR